MTRGRDAGLIVALSLAVAGGTCDRHYGMSRTVHLPLTPEPTCVEQALRATPSLGTVTHRCDNSPDDGALTDYFRLNADSRDAWVALSIPRAPGRPSMARFYWGQLNRRPSPERVAEVRQIMQDAYAAARTHCPGLPEPTQVREECGWCE